MFFFIFKRKPKIYFTFPLPLSVCLAPLSLLHFLFYLFPFLSIVLDSSLQSVQFLGSLESRQRYLRRPWWCHSRLGFHLSSISYLFHFIYVLMFLDLMVSFGAGIGRCRIYIFNDTQKPSRQGWNFHRNFSIYILNQVRPSLSLSM